MLFVPDKSGGSKVPSGFSSGGSNLNSAARPFVPGQFQSPTKRTLSIVDPETGEEIKPPTNTTPPRHNNNNNNPNTMPILPQGVGQYRPPPPHMYPAGPNYYYPMMIPQYTTKPVPYPNAPPPHHILPNQTPKIFPEFTPANAVVAPTTTTATTTPPAHTPLTITTPTPTPKTSSILISEAPVDNKKTPSTSTSPQQPKESTSSTNVETTATTSSNSSDIAFSVPNSDVSPVTTSTTSGSSTTTNKEEEVNGSRPTKMNPFSIETSSIDTNNTSASSSNNNELKEIKISSSDSVTDFNKKIYDRDFLLQFKEHFVEKPENLPSLNELLISESSGGGSGTPRSQNRNPRNTSGGSGAPRSQAPPGFNSRGSGGGRGMSSPSGGRRVGGSKSKMTKSFSTEQLSGSNILEPTAGRWEPPSAKFKRDASEDQIILSKVKGYLNKITEAKFEVLSNKIIFIALETIELLEGAIKLVFDKAVTEPKFCTMYAELCRKLSEKSPVFERDGKPVNFKRLLLNRCQEEFEGSFTKTPKKSTPPEEELTPDDKLKIEEEEFLQKKRMLGNITFIGELYKLNMLTEKIMHECITRLLGDIKNPSHEDMEALCKLMTTIGQKLDHSKAKDYMDKYFARMKELSRNKQLPSRIRFMLQDVIALRQNKWLSKKDPTSSSSSASTSTTTGSTSNTSNVEIPRSKEILSRNTHGSRPTSNTDKGGNKGVQLSSSPDWETVGGNKPTKGRGGMSSRGTTSTFEEDDEPKSMRQSSNLGGPVTLGPQGGLAGFKGGAKGWNQQSTSASTATSTSSGSDKKSGTFSSKGGYSESSSTSSKKTESTYKKLENVSTLSIDELHTKSEEILEELFSSGEIKEAVTCVKELSSPSFMSEFVSKAIGIALEKKESDRETVTKLFFSLLEEEVISSSQFTKGFDSVTEILEDLVIDIPKVYTYYASLVGLAIVDDCLPLNFIDKLLDIHLSSNNYSKASRVLADIIRSMAHASSYSKVRELIKESKFDITKVLAPEKRNNEDSLISYLESEKLTGLNPSLTYGKTIEKMITDKSSSGSILDYIHEHVPEGERSDVNFCREIVKHILKLVVSNVKQQQDIVNQYSELLSRLLIDTSLQQQCLLEVNDLVDSKSMSKENALSLLKSLRESNVVKNKALLKWKEEFGNKDLVKSASDLITTNDQEEEEQDEDQEEEDYEEQDYNSDE